MKNLGASLLGVAYLLVLTPGTTPATQLKETVDSHVTAAKAAAAGEHTALFDRLCINPDPPARSATANAAAPAAPAIPPKSSWYAEPMKVFDNLYYVGEKEYSAWAVTTSQGIIIIDTIFDYSVEDEIDHGLRKLGLNPADIRYVIVSHGHFDHSGGARYLQEKFGATVILSAADWDLLERNTRDRSKPKRDMVATDGQKLTLGDTTLTLYITPGHTPGTISTLIPVKDNGKPHLAAAWGGTAFNFTHTKPAFETYIRSAQRFYDIVAKAGADVLISNHTNFDGSKTKQPALAKRKPNESHPYVIGNDSVKRYMKVAEACAKAGMLRLN